MAFNWQTFRTRTLTAIIFVAVMLAGLLWNHWSFLVLFSIIHFGCWWEYLKLTEKIHNTSFHAYTKLGLMVMGYGIMLCFCGPAYHINNYGLKENISLPVSAAGFALLLIGIFQKRAIKLKAFGMALLGLVYISLCWGLMMDLYNGIEIMTHCILLLLILYR
jgi:phosphatidate cytidylyltransferase